MDIMRIRVRTGYIGDGKAIRVYGGPSWDSNPHNLIITFNPDMIEKAYVADVVADALHEINDLLIDRLNKEVKQQ